MEIENFGVEILEEPIKSLLDKKEYRVIRLRNGLTATLISDLASLQDKPDCLPKIDCCHSDDEEEEEIEDEDIEEDDTLEDEEMDDEMEEEMINLVEEQSMGKQRQTRYLSAASLTIGAGSFEDPGDIQGLMHFLEHMVFMGSEKYPKENCFDNFIKKCGGTDNAHTDLEDTTFYFDVQEMHFEKALDMFANFFIFPLMKEEAMQRERKSVHSEFQEALNDDECRKQQIFASIANQNHPMSRFTFGNEKTLQLDISNKELHSKLHQLRSKLYSAQHMTLAVQARESLDHLQDMVVRIFSKIPNNGVPKPSYDTFGFPFSDREGFHKLYKVIPVSDVHVLDINWALPSLLKYYEYKPLHYISYLIGHEGYGSIISYLKKRVWAIDICSGNDESGFDHNSTYAVFNITIRLTNEGFANLDKVLEVVFQYLDLMKKEGINDRIFSEIQKMEQIDFDYSEESNTSDNVQSISEDMQLYPPKHILAGGNLLFKYDPSIITGILEKLTPQNCNIMVSSRAYEKENLPLQEEQWFGTKYCCEDIPRSWVSVWENPVNNSTLHLPLPNEFIPDNFDILKWEDSEKEPPQYPRNIFQNLRGQLWFKQDLKFSRPKAYCYIYFYVKELRESALMGAMLDLFINLFTQHIMEAMYPANMAQYVIDGKASSLGLVIKISGFNQKIHKCIDLILSEIKNFQNCLDEKVFTEMVNQQIKSYHNSAINADVLRRDIRLSLLQDCHWLIVSKMRSLVKLRLEDFKNEFVTKLLKTDHIEVLIQGNITEESAKNLYLAITSISQPVLPCEVRGKMRTRKLEVGEKITRLNSLNIASANTSVVHYYQGDVVTLKKELLNEFIIMAMDEPVFDTLRTKDQLGYHVYCTSRNTDGILGISITVNSQANKYNATHINERVEAFLKVFLENLKNISEEEMNSLRETLKNFKLTVDVTLKDEVERNWDEITNCDYLFARHAHQLQIIPSITLENVVSYLSALVCPSSRKYRKLSVQVVGSSNPEENRVPAPEDLIGKSEDEVITFLPPTEDDKKFGLSEDHFVINMKSYSNKLEFFEVPSRAS